MTNYKSRRPRQRYSKLRTQHIQKGDGWTPLTFCGTGLSYSDSDSAGCGVLGRRMVLEQTMIPLTPTTTRIILPTNRIIRKIANAEIDEYTTPYTLYTYSMIPHTKYDLSYYCVTTTTTTTEDGCEVAA